MQTQLLSDLMYWLNWVYMKYFNYTVYSAYKDHLLVRILGIYNRLCFYLIAINETKLNVLYIIIHTLIYLIIIWDNECQIFLKGGS